MDKVAEHEVDHAAFIERVDAHIDLARLSVKVCVAFDIGNYQSHEVITSGYEDLNVHLCTTAGTYLLKVFARDRSYDECVRYGVLNDVVIKAGITTPKLLSKRDGTHLFTDGKNGARCCLMPFIEGDTFLAQHLVPTEDERRWAIEQAAKIHTIELSLPLVYDPWCIQNIEQEYALNETALLPDDRLLVELVLKEMSQTRSIILPHRFIHGDIIVGNVMRDVQRKLHLIDFSTAVANRYPRIQELAVMIAWFFFDPQHPDNLESLTEETIRGYSLHHRLTKEEIAVLPIYVRAVFATLLVQTSHKRQTSNDRSHQVHEFYARGKAGLVVNSA